MTKRGKVIRFWRGARRHPHWDMGTPPGGSTSKARRSRVPTSGASAGGRSLWRWLAGGIIVTGLIGPVGADYAHGYLRDWHGGCRVWQIVDGDTVHASCPEDGPRRTRLLGFDTPEVKARCVAEAWGAARAQWMLRWTLWRAQDLRLVPQGEDRYGRRLMGIWVDGDKLSARMVAAGVARFYDGGPRAGWCGKEGQDV